MRRGVLFSVLLALAAGCTTVKTSTTFHDVNVEGDRVPLATVEVENSGWFVFGVLPLASGDPRLPNRAACNFFENTVTLENNVSVLRRTAEKLGAASMVNVTSHWTDETVFVILLKRRAFHTSAVLLKPEENGNLP